MDRSSGRRPHPHAHSPRVGRPVRGYRRFDAIFFLGPDFGFDVARFVATLRLRVKLRRTVALAEAAAARTSDSSYASWSQLVMGDSTSSRCLI
jgi:hypothetical protein